MFFFTFKVDRQCFLSCYGSYDFEDYRPYSLKYPFVMPIFTGGTHHCFKNCFDNFGLTFCENSCTLHDPLLLDEENNE